MYVWTYQISICELVIEGRGMEFSLANCDKDFEIEIKIEGLTTITYLLGSVLESVPELVCLCIFCGRFIHMIRNTF